MPKISIITPVYNGLPYIKQCVESVLKQELTDWEMLIGNNCSTDNTKEYLNSLDDSRIKIFHHEDNLGAYGNLNFLFSRSNSPLSQILCADDYFLNNQSLNTLIDFWETLPSDFGIVKFNKSSFTYKGLVKYEKKTIPEIIEPEQSIYWHYVFGHFLGNLSNISLRTHIVEEIGEFDQSYPHVGDYDFFIKAAKQHKMYLNEQDIIYVRKHEGAASVYLNKKGEHIEQRIKVVNKLFRCILENKPKNKSLLKLWGTINHDSLQRYVAVKIYLFGNKHLMKSLIEANKKAEFLLPKLLRLLIFVFSLGGRLWRVIIAKMLLKQLKLI